MDAIRARRTLERVTKPRPDEKRRRLFKSSEWDLEEPEAFARIARSPVELALITGVVIRLFRAVVLTRSNASSADLFTALILGSLFLLGMATAATLRPSSRHSRGGRRSSRCSRLLERWR